MQVALFIDLLGARRKWQNGGVAEATRAFNHFSRMVIAATRQDLSGRILNGGIETDSAMLICDSPLTALEIARRIYHWAFQNAQRPDAPRLWLRGSLVPFEDAEFIRREAYANQPLDNISIFTYSADALDAISIEKAGFKGMRLLVREEVVDDDTKAALRITLNGYSLIPIRRLRHIGYPTVVEGRLMDFLWMATGNEEEWYQISLHMTSRLRHSAKDAEEFAQAAATQVVFHECAAITQSVRSRARRAAQRTEGQQVNGEEIGSADASPSTLS